MLRGTADCGEKLTPFLLPCQVWLATGRARRYGRPMKRGHRTLFFALCCAAAGCAAATPAEPELVLAGGSLRLCSGLASGDCEPGTELPPGRAAASYALTPAQREAALDPLLWPARERGFLAQLDAQLQAATEALGEAAVARSVLIERLAERCSDCPAPLWNVLSDHERASLLAAFELPQLEGGARLREQVALAQSRDAGSIAVVQAFVDAAARRADGRPRIALVTASSIDAFDPVDFYLGLFAQAGAEPFWWPVDAALASIVFADDGDCDDLDRARRRELGLPRRELVYPDLAAEQRAWCEREDAAGLPPGIDAVFFTGGDQWRLRRAFVGADDAANRWLQELRVAFAAGRVAIGGTSAGTAVQSAQGMLSNGEPRHALRHGPRAVPPPVPGCARGDRCNGVDEDQLTLWPGGGFGLAGPFLLDTHFSERAREWRLLRALAGLPVRLGLGVDEGSAIRIRHRADGSHELEAIGSRGGWLFEVAQRGCGQLAGRAHYLAPGGPWRLDSAGLASLQPLPSAAMPARAPADDPLASGAIRRLAWNLAAEPSLQSQSADLEQARLRLQRGADSLAWRRADAAPGISGLRFEFAFAEPGCGET
jgi:hypothetical protein